MSRRGIFRLTYPRAVVGTGVVVALALTAALMVSGGASARGDALASQRLSPALAGPRPATRPRGSARVSVKSRLSLAVSGTHHLYAEDGTSPNGIDVFTLSGSTVTFAQHVTVGTSSSLFLGGHHLAWTTFTAGSPAANYSCLAFADGGNGTVYSFKIKGDGTLSVSPISTVAVGGGPGDLAVWGSVLFESNPSRSPHSLDVLSFGPGCTLSLLHQTSTGSELDVNIALINGPNQLTSADLSSGHLVIYSLGPGGVLTESAVQPGQITGPDGTSVWNTGGGVINVYTGQASSGPPQAQGHRLGVGPFDSLQGSPQTDTDTSSSNGAAVAVDSADKLLIQANNHSGQIGWYKLTAGSTATVGSIAFGGDTPLALNDLPTSMQVFGSDLFVAQENGGDVEDCALATTGVSGCHTIATLSGAGTGAQGSVAIK